MTVAELLKELEAMPGTANVDAMFPQGNGAYAVTGVELMELRDGRQFVILDIVDQVPLRAV
jgi:hypothetical protein